MAEDKYILIMTTCINGLEAGRIIDILCRKKLVACAQMHEVKSFYNWENQTRETDEILLYLKTRYTLYDKIEDVIKKENKHYKIPEIIKIPIKGGLSEYLNWIDEVTEQEPEQQNSTHKSNQHTGTTPNFTSPKKWYR